jgi:hypothetical protein
VELPDGVILALLKREVLLATAKQHALAYEHTMAKMTLKTLKTHRLWHEVCLWHEYNS